MILIQEGKIFVEGKETNDPTLIGLSLLDFVNSPSYSPVDMSLRKEQREKHIFFFIDIVHENTKYNFSQAASEFEIRVKEKMLLHKQQNNLKKITIMSTNLECSEKPIKVGNEKCQEPTKEVHRDGGVALNNPVKKNNFFNGLIASFKANLSFLKTKKAVENFKKSSENAIGLHNPMVQNALITEYNLIVEKKSKLSAKERKYVSNKIAYMIENGIIKKV